MGTLTYKIDISILHQLLNWIKEITDLKYFNNAMKEITDLKYLNNAMKLSKCSPQAMHIYVRNFTAKGR